MLESLLKDTQSFYPLALRKVLERRRGSSQGETFWTNLINKSKKKKKDEEGLDLLNIDSEATDNDAVF